MGDFKPRSTGGYSGGRSDNRRSGGFGGGRSGGFNRGGDRGGSRGGFGGGNRGGFGGGDRNRRPVELHDVVCDKCGKETQVPFKPTGDKPVFCRDCYDAKGGDAGRSRDGGRDRNSRDSGRGSSQGGMTSDQFKELNTKLDSILEILKDLEIVEDDEAEEEEVPEEDTEKEKEEALEEEKEEASEEDAE